MSKAARPKGYRAVVVETVLNIRSPESAHFFGGRLASRFDFTCIGLDPSTNTYHVHEQLYPEARGFLVHEFASEAEANAWIEAQNADA